MAIAAEQAYAFAVMAGCGALLGVLGDLLSPLRHGMIGHAADLLLGILAAAGMTIAALVLETDAFRLYTFAGVMVGMLLYAATIGTIVRKLARHVRAFVKKRGILVKNVRDDAGKSETSANV